MNANYGSKRTSRQILNPVASFWTHVGAEIRINCGQGRTPLVRPPESAPQRWSVDVAFGVERCSSVAVFGRLFAISLKTKQTNRQPRSFTTLPVSTLSLHSATLNPHCLPIFVLEDRGRVNVTSLCRHTTSDVANPLRRFHQSGTSKARPPDPDFIAPSQYVVLSTYASPLRNQRYVDDCIGAVLFGPLKPISFREGGPSTKPMPYLHREQRAWGIPPTPRLTTRFEMG